MWGKLLKPVLPILFLSTMLSGCREDPLIYPSGNNMNKLYIESSPEGAHIFLSGIYTEKRTPAWLLNLEPGSYQITLKLGGLIDSTVVVTLNDNATKTIIVKMEN